MEDTLPLVNASRLVVCFIADASTVERLPTALRYLLVGMVDECVGSILVVPEGVSVETLAPGSARVITHHSSHWPILGWTRHRLVNDVLRVMDEQPRATTLVVHSLQPQTAVLAAEIAAATDGDALVTISTEGEIGDVATVLRSVREMPGLATPSRRLRGRMVRALPNAPLVETLPFGAVVSPTVAAFASPQLAPTLVVAGDLTPDCGLEPLLRAAKLARQDYPGLLVFIIGKGPAEPGLRRIVDMLDLRAAVTFAGPYEHPRLILESADIFFIPRGGSIFREEAIQAAAVGLAIIAADDAPYDWLKDGETALLFAENDEGRIAERINRLLSDRAMARSLATGAQAAAKAEHSIARMVSEHVRVYRQLESRHKTLTLPAAR